jgi:hypothetical protein
MGFQSRGHITFNYTETDSLAVTMEAFAENVKRVQNQAIKVPFTAS